MRRLAVVLVAGASLVVPVKEAGAAATGQASQASRPSVRMDFNGDGFGDLAIGVSYEDVGTIENAGAVEVIYGSASGLSATAKPDQFWTQNSPDVNDKAETDDFFGDALTAGDFNGDGFA